MMEMKELPNVVGLLGDVVASRTTRRGDVHSALLQAITHTNESVDTLDPLRVTVGDEIQGVYATLGQAYAAASTLRDLLFGTAELRFGLGGGNIRVIDNDRGIQDGTAWWLAREAIDFVEKLSREPGYDGVRTAVRDERPAGTPAADAMMRLVDVNLASLRAGSRRSLIGLQRGEDNAEVARHENISPSANSQRVQNNNLRPLAEAIAALQALH